MTNDLGHEAKVRCEEVRDWIWSTRLDIDQPPDDYREHLAGCGFCSEEQFARGALSTDLRALRTELNEEPPRALGRRVLEVVSAGTAPRDSASHHRVSVPPVSAPPQATPQWMVSAAALLMGALLLGFLGGRFTATGFSGFAGASPQAVHTTLATAPAGSAARGIDWRNMHRPHQVGISPAGLSRLQDGRTYLMTGPVGGPYQVVGAVRFEEVDLPAVLPRGEHKEIVVAVGPTDGWHTGRELALAELSESGAEILGRRKVEDPPVRVGFTAP